MSLRGSVIAKNCHCEERFIATWQSAPTSPAFPLSTGRRWLLRAWWGVDICHCELFRARQSVSKICFLQKKLNFHFVFRIPNPLRRNGFEFFTFFTRFFNVKFENRSPSPAFPLSSAVIARDRRSRGNPFPREMRVVLSRRMRVRPLSIMSFVIKNTGKTKKQPRNTHVCTRGFPGLLYR